MEGAGRDARHVVIRCWTTTTSIAHSSLYGNLPIPCRRTERTSCYKASWVEGGAGCLRRRRNLDKTALPTPPSEIEGRCSDRDLCLYETLH
jgi:hypothetical protein